MSSKRNSSMASVWDTLNAMKSRQEAAKSFTKGCSRTYEARMKMCSIFQQNIDTIVHNRLCRAPSSQLSSKQGDHHSPTTEEEVHNLLGNFRSECMSNPTVSQFENECIRKAKTNPETELQNLKHLLGKAEQSLSLSRLKLQRSEQTRKNINTSWGLFNYSGLLLYLFYPFFYFLFLVFRIVGFFENEPDNIITRTQVLNIFYKIASQIHSRDIWVPLYTKTPHVRNVSLHFFVLQIVAQKNAFILSRVLPVCTIQRLSKILFLIAVDKLLPPVIVLVHSHSLLRKLQCPIKWARRTYFLRLCNFLKWAR